MIMTTPASEPCNVGAPSHTTDVDSRSTPATQSRQVDVVIIGGGPAATFTAMYLLQKGITPLIVEKEVFPRYHIGESLTGEVGAALIDLGLESAVKSANYPIKHGVRVYGQGGNNQFWVPVMKRVQPGPGGLTPAHTWQVRRDEFDTMLLNESCARGASHLHGAVQSVIRDGQHVRGVVVATDNGIQHIHSKVVVDASGQKTFLAQQGLTSPRERGGYENQVALYSRVKGEVRDPGDASGNTLIFYSGRHRWSWFIPISEEQTSLGLVVPARDLAESGLSPEQYFHQQIRTLNPALTSRLQNAEFTEKVRSASNYSYRISQYTGSGFLCVGDSHRFVDPIFSFGLFFASRESKLAATEISQTLASGTTAQPDAFLNYQQQVEQGQNVIQDLIDFFWDYPLAFQLMAHRTHVEDIADCFAGRVYTDTPSDAITTIRSILQKSRSGKPVAEMATNALS
jgi:FADH2-dependent halogenase